MTSTARRVLPVLAALLTVLALSGAAVPPAGAAPARQPLQRGDAVPSVLRVDDLEPGAGGVALRTTSVVPRPAAQRAPRSTWIVDYDSDMGPTARAAFQAAVDTWAEIVASTVPIRVEVKFDDLRDPGLLGSTYAKDLWRDATLGDGVSFYPSALADALLGYDTEDSIDRETGRPTADMVASFNSAADSVYYGSGTPTSGQIDFQSVVLHELGHGLGFVGVAGVSNGRGSVGGESTDVGGRYWTVYDRFVMTSAGRRADTLPYDSPQTAAELQSGFLGWRGDAGRAPWGGEWPSLFAPDRFQIGSSYSHLDEETYPRGDVNSLMTPYLSYGEVVRTPGPIARGILQDLGWPATGGGSAARPTFRFVPLTPARVLDTRTGLGAPAGRVAAGRELDLTVTGAGGVPANNVAAVVLNVTAVGPSSGTYVTAYPTGGSLPTVSNLNPVAGQDVAGLVTVRVGRDGAITLYNNAGLVDLVADVAGYYTQASGALPFTSVVPTRILNTLSSGTPLGQGGIRSVPVAGTAGVPSDVQAVVLNVTAVGPTSPTYLTVWPTGTTQPNASNLNVPRGVDLPNLVVVKVGGSGAVSLFNALGSTHVIADVAGYYAPSAGSAFVPVVPRRLLDTRSTGRVGAGGTVALGLGSRGLPALVDTVAVNVTAVGPTAGGFITVYPQSAGQPTASNLNTRPAVDSPNLAVVRSGSNDTVALYNNVGQVDLIADLAGYFVPTG